MIEGWVHLNPSEVEAKAHDVDAALRQWGLTLQCANTGLGVQMHHRSPSHEALRQKNLENLLGFLAPRGVKTAAIQPLAADKERPCGEVFADCLATLDAQIPAGHARGLQFALELHVHSPFETLEQARMLLEARPEMALVYDPTHFIMQGHPLKESTWLMTNARHCHLRDAAPGQLQCPFGLGELDVDWVVKALQDHGYTGDVSIEYLGTDDFDVVESAQRLRDALQAAGAE
jgi:sugar phosphate isomerase/epimerase